MENPAATTFFDALYSNNLVAMRRFLQVDSQHANTPDLDCSNNNKTFPLHWAVQQQQQHNDMTIDLLLEFDAAVNTIDTAGRTPLVYASECGNCAAVRRLLSAGANPNLFLDCDDETSSSLSDDDDESSSESSSSSSSSSNSPILVACDKARINVISELLSAGADPNAADDDGDTAVFWPTHWNNADCLQEFIKAGADVNARNKRGSTPLHEAAFRGLISIVELLLSAGANVNVADCRGNTPLHRAVEWKHQGVIEVLLLQGGANVHLKNKADETALQKAMMMMMMQSSSSSQQDGDNDDTTGVLYLMLRECPHVWCGPVVQQKE